MINHLGFKLRTLHGEPSTFSNEDSPWRVLICLKTEDSPWRVLNFYDLSSDHLIIQSPRVGRLRYGGGEVRPLRGASLQGDAGAHAKFLASPFCEINYG